MKLAKLEDNPTSYATHNSSCACCARLPAAHSRTSQAAREHIRQIPAERDAVASGSPTNSRDSRSDRDGEDCW